MKSMTIDIPAKDGLALHSYLWIPSDEIDVKAILLLIHGSVEHAKRYEQFGTFLANHGIGVVAFDLRGHGKTTDINSSDFAHIPYKTGWGQLMYDIEVVQNKIKTDFPNKPCFLFGHSMGSFLVRDYIVSRSSNFNGLILSGTTKGNATEVKLLAKVTKLMAIFNNPKNKSTFLHKQVYSNLNKGIENPETPVDFISTDKKEVEKYMNDELSGRTISIGYAHEMAKGLLRTRKDSSINQIPKNLPILMVSGKEDPVGGKKGKDVTALYKSYQKANIQDVKLNLYEGARHELLNEFKRDKVMKDILNWMNSHI